MAQGSGNFFYFPVSDIAAICGVDLSTARRWLRGASCPPPAALVLLRLMRERDIGCFHPAWVGWKINLRGELVSPENWIATPGDVLSIQLTQAQLSAYRSENRQLKADLQAMEAGFLEEQPAPENWSIALES